MHEIGAEPLPQPTPAQPTPAQPTALALTPAQERTLALLRRSGEPMVFPEAFVEHLRAEATTAAAELSERLGGETLWVSKSFLARVHGCEVQHMQPDDFSWRPATAAGFVAHKAIELALNWRGEPAPSEVVDQALARLADQPDAKGSFVAGLTDADWAELRSRAVDRCTKFLQDFPPLPLSAQPVLEAAAKWRPPGTIELSSKADLVIGKPAGRESRLLIVDFKSGYRSHHHRDDLRFYAVVQTLRQAVPPRRLVTYYLDYAESEVEDVTEGTLQSGLNRALEGIEKHIELTVEGRQPVKRVGVACRWCPLQHECTEGRAFLHGDDQPDVEP
ncbi:MAG: PD-(D/E)XK nuclease family protein [Actinomycetota bacterium]|nr:PD-(D/E)XK nuclease family protein [Actinomycetota bacterium]